MVPFHLWAPDVYQGAPAPVTAFLSTGSKVALFAALLRFASYSSNEVWSYFMPVIWILSVFTMVVGTITALAQTRVKRLLAYSSIGPDGIPVNGTRGGKAGWRFRYNVLPGRSMP